MIKTLIRAKREIARNKYYPLFRFILKLNLFAAPLYLLLLTGWQFPLLIDATYSIVFSLLAAIGLNPAAYGSVISVPVQNGSWGALINWDCTGWKSALALFALIFATDQPMKRKATGFLLLVPVLLALNIARIVFIFWYVSAFGIADFAVVHTLVWSWGLAAAVAILWLAWLKPGNLIYPSGQVIKHA